MASEVERGFVELPWKREDISPGIRRLWWVCLVTFLILSVGYSFTRSPWWDEGVFGDPANTLALKNRMGSTCLDDMGYIAYPKVHEYTYWQFPGYIVLTGLLYKLTGASVVAMRLLNIPLALFYLWAWRGFLWRLTGDARWSLFVSAVLAVDYSLVGAASNGRMDMMCASMGMASLMFLLDYLRHSTLRSATLSGLCLAISVVTHPVAAIYGLAWVAILVWLWWTQRSSMPGNYVRAAFCFASPFVVIGGSWLIYIAQDPQTFLAQFGASSAYRVRKSLNPLAVIWTDLVERYFKAFIPPSGINRYLKAPLTILPFLAAASLLLIAPLRRSRAVILLVGLSGLLLSGLAYVDNQIIPPYYVHTMPWLTMLFCIPVYWMGGLTSARRGAALTILPVFILLSAGGNAMRILLNSYKNEFTPVIQLLKEPVSEGQVVMGGSELGFGLGFVSNLVDDRYLGYYSKIAEPAYYVESPYFVAVDSSFREGFRFRNNVLRDRYRLVLENSKFKVYQRR